MILLQANKLYKSFGVIPILENIQLEIKSGERVGLVGVNGAGKSTLLKILVGELSYDQGDIIRGKETSIGYLDQNSGLESELSIWDEMVKVFSFLIKQEKRLRRLEQQIADPAIAADERAYEKLLQEYAQESEEFKEKGGYQYEATIRSVLHGFGFADKDYEDSISSLSGGQKTRLALAKLLLQQPDLLILDEPTNHLDLDTLSWLEQYLKGYPGGILLVSHDRYFLDRLVNVIYEIDRQHSKKYHGNYTDFLEQKAADYEQQLKQYNKQQKDIQRMEAFVQKNLARASTTKRAQSRRKALEKMERIEQPNGELKRASIRFDIDRQSGHDVLKVEDLVIGYEQELPLAKDIQFRVNRGDRIAVVGPNGTGKSTLLKTMIDRIPSLSGNISKGTNVSIGYYDQEQYGLHEGKTILQELWDDYPHMLERDVRNVLGHFLFSGDDVEKVVCDLSGGEKARLALAKLMLQRANLLILDEPTNHLDIYSKEVLEQSLLDYPGTILFVSHDRYFINRVANKVLELTQNGVQLYLGDYNYFLEKKQELAQIEQLKSNQEHSKTRSGEQVLEESTNKRSDKENYERNKELQRLERRYSRLLEELEAEITSMEDRIQVLENDMCLPEVYEDYEKSLSIQKELEQLKTKLEQKFEEWSAIEEEKDATFG